MNNTRGERNNNPGNIRKSPIAWRGEVPGIDTAFETFATPEMGIRALAKLLRHYTAEGFDTPREIINRYAPHTENDTNAYLSAVCKQTGLQPDEKVNFASDDLLHSFVAAIITHENGRNIYSAAVINKAITSLSA